MIPARPSVAAMRFFDGYVARYLRRRFHRVHLWGEPDAVAAPRRGPTIFAMSHAAWWDVLVGYHLARRVIGVESYAPMDEAQLARYRILTRLGVYSVARGSAAGAREFLRYTADRLRAGGAVWITPQGEMAPHWRRPVRFQEGIGHLVRRVPGVAVVPVAVAYEFIDEPRPEIVVKLGPPRWPGPGGDRADIVRQLEADLERELDAIRDALTRRDLSACAVLLEGATSTSALYDRVRRLRAWVTGRRDPARHGDVVSDPRRGAAVPRSDSRREGPAPCSP
jgi:1-acyl-sn-glycerol-3-phosphate acyltransferase